jgi:Amt family ammonium transporter
VASAIILKIVDMVVGLRVDGDEETQGLDLVLHDERGYDL